MTRTAATPQPAFEILLSMIRGFQVSQMIYVAAKLGLADLLAEGAESAADLAAVTGTHAPSLYRLLRALASVGIFAEDEQGRFGLTPLAEGLRNDVPGSLRAVVLYMASPTVQRVWGDLLYSVQTGGDAYHHLYGIGAWEYREQNPDMNAVFNDYMTALTRFDTPSIASAYDFSSIRVLADLGGGEGSLLAAILKANPALRGVVFDLPHVVSGAKAVLEEAGVADRCEVVGGDFFGSLPHADTYMFKSVIHGLDDENTVLIFKNVRRAIPPEGKLLLIEFVIPPENDPHPGKFADIHMLVAPGGQERTEAEWRALLSEAGFRLTHVIPITAGRSIIEAVPV
jgi:hypothetical protein